MNATNRGLTLMELLIAMAVCAVLFSVAMPGFRAQITVSERREAQLKLLELHGFQYQYRLEHGRFAATNELPGGAVSGYLMVVENLTASTFLLVATRSPAQAGQTCNRLTLDESAHRSPQQCWN